VRIGQFRAVKKDKVDVAQIGRDVTESSSLAAGELEDDHFRVDRVEEFLGLRCFRQNQFTQLQSHMHDIRRTACQKIEKLWAWLLNRFHLSKIIGSPGKTTPGSVTEA